MPRGIKNKNIAMAPAIIQKKKSKLYSMPEKIAEGTILTDLSKSQWCVGKTIGTGGFGDIYSACRVGEKNFDFVVKCEPHGNGPLFVEMHFYMRKAKLEDIQRYKKTHGLKSLGMPHMIGNGSLDINGIKHRFIVMPRYGSDIQKYYLMNGNSLPEGTVYRIILQMLYVYEFIHSTGYIHADLKAANILLGIGKEGNSQTYLVDYGMASHFTTTEFKPDPRKMHNGTIEFTSRDAHQGVSTMRSDLEILGYNIITWLGRDLPWVTQKILQTPVKVQKAKEDFMHDTEENLKKLFQARVPEPVNEFFKYVGQMNYNDAPDYTKLQKIFLKALKTLNLTNSGDLNLIMESIKNNNTSKTMKKRNHIELLNCFNDGSSEDDGVLEKPRGRKRSKSPVKPNLRTVNKKTRTNNGGVEQTVASSKKLISNTKQKTEQSYTGKKDNNESIISNTRKRRSVSNSPIKPKYVKLSKDSISKRSKMNISPKQKSVPVSANTNINVSPVISVSNSCTPKSTGKTVIKDNLTPNPKAIKVYEFNFDLDVSMDANVIVNVNRKKKPANAFPTNNSGNRNSQSKNHTNSPNMSMEGVKIVKINEKGTNLTTPVISVKKSGRIAKQI